LNFPYGVSYQMNRMDSEFWWMRRNKFLLRKLDGILGNFPQINGSLPQSTSKQDKKAIKKDEQPFGWMVEKGLVPLMLLVSLGFGFFVLTLADFLYRRGHRQLANIFVFVGFPLVVFGWLVIILLAAFLDGRI